MQRPLGITVMFTSGSTISSAVSVCVCGVWGEVCVCVCMCGVWGCVCVCMWGVCGGWGCECVCVWGGGWGVWRREGEGEREYDETLTFFQWQLAMGACHMPYAVSEV